ncbi:hypothetical protein [Alloalcanivorax xenomutans]|uniref:hypothetical protein n=1 Tax=Alloalcanivorax xenomutans TaxID=1094342 RepID=UPI0007A7484F|nr:hypothetical protein [Alloalcanivorax xenomutans]KYZ87627.1 hypothetical protein A3Q32_11700 [Alcanivorax sp. KX64203]WOA30964.1 hypothetical protein RVY87_19130 [Alloalcanivorax xenomutans]
MENNAERTEQAPSSPTWDSQLTEGLAWLNNRAWPLAAGTLFTSALYLHNYIIEEKVPLSLTSPTIITALPILFAVQVFIIALLVALVLMPTAILFTPTHVDGPKLIEEMGLENLNDKNRKPARRRLLGRWLLALLLMSIAWLALAKLFKDSNSTIAALFALFLPIVLFAVVAIKGLWRFWRFSPDFILMALGTGLAQILALMILGTAVMSFLASTEQQDTWGYPLGLLVVLVFGLLQFISVVLIVTIQNHRNPVAWITLRGFALVVLIGLFPPASAKLAGYTLQTSASGARSCAVLLWQKTPPGLKAIALDDSRSRNVKILLEAEGRYVVRQHTGDPGTNYFVPSDQVNGIAACTPVAESPAQQSSSRSSKTKSPAPEEAGDHEQTGSIGG